MQGLSVGQWLAFADRDGATRELKLAWISPRRRLFLLDNREGERAVSLSAADFAAALHEGRARLINDREESAAAPQAAGAHRSGQG